MTDQLVNVTIDGKAVSVPAGTLVWEAASSIDTDIPIFCYQDRMPPFGLPSHPSLRGRATIAE